MVSFKWMLGGIKVRLFPLLVFLWVGSSWADCNKINTPWWDYPLSFSFGTSLYIDPATPVGTMIAQQTASSTTLAAINGGWFAICDTVNDEVKYWWLEQHNSRSAGDAPINGVTAPTKDGNMYVMQDNGRDNPYGGSGSGSIGYTVELLTSGNAYPFSWLSSAPNKNLPSIEPGPVKGIICADAKSGVSGYPPYTGNCNANQTVVNWQQLGSFTLKISLYRLAGKIPATGLIMTNNSGSGFSLFSVMDNGSTPPGWNTRLFNLVKLRLANDVKLQTAPCQAFNSVAVNLGSVNRSAFTGLGKPADGVADTSVNVTAQCSTNTSMKWAVMGTTSDYNSDGTQGILTLDKMANSADGVGVQLTDTSGNPLPITLVTSVDYKWIDTNLISNASGILLIQFLARYVQIGTVTPGVADSHAYLVIAPK